MFWYIIIALVAIAGVYALYIEIKTKRQGIETVATVTGVSKEWSVGGNDPDLEYKYYIEYINKNGEKVETVLGGMTTGNKHLEEGDRIRVRYLPEKQEYPIMVGRV